MAATTREELEQQIRDIQSSKANLSKKKKSGRFEGLSEVERVELGAEGHFDQDIYGSGRSKFEGYVTSIATNDAEDDDDDEMPAGTLMGNKRANYTAPASILNDIQRSAVDYDPFAEHRIPKITDREDEYRARRRKMIISPERHDPFTDGGKTPDPKSRTYAEIMADQALNKDHHDVRSRLHEKAKAGELHAVNGSEQPVSKPTKRRRWDQAGDDTPGATPKKKKVPTATLR